MKLRAGDRSSLRFRAAAVLFYTAFLGACTSAPPLPAPPKELPPNDSLVVPGHRIGPVAIGMTSKQVLQAKGSPGDSSYRFTDAALYSYDQKRYNVIVDDATQQVSRVNATSDDYRTAEGVQVGQTELEMRANLGNPDGSDNMSTGDLQSFKYCYDNGLAIYIMQGKIWQISVFNPGGVCN